MAETHNYQDLPVPKLYKAEFNHKGRHYGLWVEGTDATDAAKTIESLGVDNFIKITPYGLIHIAV